MSIKELTHIPIQKTITDFHPNVKLLADYFYVQAIPLVHSIARKYQFRTIEVVKAGRKPKKKDTELGLKRVINMYHARGLRVIQVNTDNEFECIREEVWPINMNKMGDIERLGRTVNEEHGTT